MRMVEVTKGFTNSGIIFKPGHKYCMAEDVEAQYRNLFNGNFGMSYPIDSLLRPYKGEDLNGKKLLAFRTGGIGDLFWLSTVLRYIKKKYPTCFIRAASACKFCMENVPEINELYDMPFDAELFNDIDYTVFFQGIIESASEDSKKTHAVDMFFKYFSIDSSHIPAEDKRPKLFFTRGEMDWADRTLKSLGITSDHYVIGIQMETSAPLRNFPKEKFKVCINFLSKENNVKILLIGSREHDILINYYKGGNPNVIPATAYSVRQSIVLATRYNMVISPDSFMVQVAGALEKPLIGIYGPFPSDVRMKYFKNAIGLDPKVACSPCFKHDFRGCIRGFPSPCFTQVSIEDVLQAADYLKAKFSGTHFRYMDRFLQEPNLSEIEQYMLSADKGLCFFPGYYKPQNAITVDINKFVRADITDLSTDLKRASFPFVLFMGNIFGNTSTYHNSKNMVRPGGYFLVYMRDGNEQMYNEIKKDVGSAFILQHSRFDSGNHEMVIAGKRPY